MTTKKTIDLLKEEQIIFAQMNLTITENNLSEIWEMLYPTFPKVEQIQPRRRINGKKSGNYGIINYRRVDSFRYRGWNK